MLIIVSFRNIPYVRVSRGTGGYLQINSVRKDGMLGGEGMRGGRTDGGFRV